MDEAHTDDIRTIEEADEVQIETSEGHLLDMTCTEITKENADPRTGLVRETTIWFFDMGGEEVVLSRVEGLRESDDIEPFPHDKAIWNITREMGYGYANEVEHVGPDARGAVPHGQERQA